MLLTTSRRILVSVVIGSALLNAAGQVLLKAARSADTEAALLTVFGRGETWAGLALYGISSVCWLWVLSRAPLSFAYPILALTFPVVVGASALLFSEAILPLRWMGVAVVMFGVALLART